MPNTTYSEFLENLKNNRFIARLQISSLPICFDLSLSLHCELYIKLLVRNNL